MSNIIRCLTKMRWYSWYCVK